MLELIYSTARERENGPQSSLESPSLGCCSLSPAIAVSAAEGGLGVALRLLSSHQQHKIVVL